VAATALALVGLFNIVGSLSAGVLGSRYSKTKLLSLIYAARAIVIAAFVLIPASSTTTVVFGAAMGVLWLSTVPLTSAIVASQFGTAHAGTLFGLVFLSHQLGAFGGAWMGGALADRAGSYDPVWWIAVGLGVMAAVVHQFIDEGPQPEPPPAVRVATSPARGMAALVLVVGLTAGLSFGSARSAEARSAADRPAAYCVLHPVT
jgi:predicted MFS family arabinose efflux permease